MRNTNKAFTLVELIVVITILAILGTIAFISLQGYTGEAKNSKVTSDLRNIASAVETSQTRNGTILFDMVNGDLSTNNGVSWAQFGSGQTLATAGDVYYNVGNVDFVSIQQNGEDFKDPNGGAEDGNEYIFATVTSPDYKGYQLAGQIIENDVKKARINGTYYQVVSTDTTWLISAASGAASGSGLVNDGTIGIGTAGNLY